MFCSRKQSVFWIKLFLSFALLMLTLACSDPIFWITSREQPVSKNNLPKDTQATGIIHVNGYYYAAVGVSLWRRPVSGGDWVKLTLPSFSVNGVGANGGTVYVGTQDGVYQSTNGTTFAKVNGYNGSAAVYQVDNTVYFVIQDSSGPLLRVYNGRNFTNPQYKVNGMFTGANGNTAVAGSNGLFTDASGNATCRFSWVSGMSRNYLYADGLLGEYNCTAGGGTWTKSVNSGQAASRGSAIYQLSVAHGTLKALFGVYGLGYFEVYEDTGTLKVRSPQSTVNDRDAYQVSDLAFATVTGFYEYQNDIFALTSRKGLWRNTAGVWYQE